MCQYSIVVPAYNEEKSLRLFYDAVTPAFDSLKEEYEVIFVNDGSRDATKEILDDLAAQDKRVKVCHFSRNFGQQAAILCGFKKSSGEAVIVMDADLQDPPEVALQMIEKWKEGYEIVHGKRKKRKGESAFKKQTANLFYKLTRKITGLELPQNTGDFKLYSRRVVDEICALPEHDRLLRTQVCWVGFSQTEVEFDRPSRVAGETHYTLKKMVRLAQSGVFPNTDYTLTFPIKLGVLLGVLSLICSIVFIVLSCLKIFYGGLIAWLYPALGFSVATLLICHGISNIHVGMIYREVQNRPLYILSKTRNFDEDEQ